MEIGLIALLQKELESRKDRNPQYSLRAFASALEISPAQLSQIISGKRNLTAKAISKISKKLSLSPLEQAHYLKDWSNKKVQFEKEDIQILEKRQLQDDEFKLISEWYHMAILSLAPLPGSSTDSHWIAGRLGITVPQAREAVDRLQRLNVLARGAQLKQISPPLSVVSETPSEAIRGYHQSILNRAMDHLEKVPAEQRDYSAMTLSINLKNMHRYRQLIEKFQEDLIELCSKDTKQDVYVMSCQFFPVHVPSERKQS
jgi:uncharacterized protein (TIGR02147 family)